MELLDEKSDQDSDRTNASIYVLSEYAKSPESQIMRMQIIT